MSDQKIALVTGASRGIGREVAKQLGEQNCHVILVARTVGALEALDDEIQAAGGSASIVPLDLKDHNLIDQLGANIYERWGKLDLLVGNAAIISHLTPVAHIEPKAWGQIMDINLTANYRLLRSMDPLLQRSDDARALFVTSGAAHGNFPYWGAYAASKAALEALVLTYANENEGRNVKANIFDPGVVATHMRAQAFPGEDPSQLSKPEDVARKIVSALLSDSPAQGKRLSAA
ncbi:MAG: SDR family NAD(P)-dependent oxidoreductase [Rickettsiales bacterium]|nr:SDR family NAD(P)-dependent oxidoreductase [Rickettsiales bacterium]